MKKASCDGKMEKKSDKNFALAETSTGFKDKCADVFGSLGAAEAKHNAFEASKARIGRERKEDYMKCEPKVEDDIDRRGHNFKRPRSSGRRSHHSSRLHSSSHRHNDTKGRHGDTNRKWCRYDLSDVSTSDMSDRSNAAAAFDFIRNLKKSKEETVEDDNNDCESDNKITFRKPKVKKVTEKESSKDKNESDKNEKSAQTFVSGKLTMPEYVVGESKIKKRTPNTTKSSAMSCGAVSLDHLADEEDEDDGDV